MKKNNMFKKVISIFLFFSLFLFFTLSCKSNSTIDQESNFIPNIYSFQNNNLYQKVLYFNKNELLNNNENNLNEINLNNLNVYDSEKNTKYSIDIKNSSIKEDNIILVLNEQFNSNQNSFIIENNNEGGVLVLKPLLLDKEKTFYKYDINSSKQDFFEIIKDISNNQIPVLIESRNSSLVLQQSMYISLINYFLNINKNKNDICILNIENASILENRINPIVLVKENIINSIYNIDTIDSTNINNLNILNDSHLFSSIDDYINHFNKIIEKFNIKNFKIDFVIPCVNFIELIMEFENNNYHNKLAHILKYVNRIIVISEGAAHTNFVIPELIKRMEKFIPDDREKIIEKLINYQNGTINNLTNKDIYNFLTLKQYETTKQNSEFNFINFYHYDGNVQNSINIMDKSLWNEKAFSTNFVEYSDLIQNIENKNSFLNIYEKIFVNEDLILKNIFVSGFDEYKKNKKNAIFLGSSLFKNLEGIISETNFSRLQNFENLRNAVQNQMELLLNKFPFDEYNIIFKLHPVFSNENDPNNNIAKNYINLITNNKIKNPIIINSNIPIETLISSNYYNYLINNNENNIFFNENETTKPYEWTTFFGLQATTTTIHTTRIFYQNAFNLSKQEVANLIPFSNFEISEKYPIVRWLEKDILPNENYYNENINSIKNIYFYYCPSIVFNNSYLKEYDSLVLNF